MTDIAQWTVFEQTLASQHTYDNPSADVAVVLQLTAPSGKSYTCDAFWDGGSTWRVRFRPDAVGTWHYITDASATGDGGLHGIRGMFECVAYQGENPLYQRGELQLSADRRRFTYADGTPYLWLADTAWNGVLRAKPADWDEYLAVRRDQGFSGVQFIGGPWRAFSHDAQGETAFLNDDPTRINPAFFQRLDSKVAAINAHGLHAIPLLMHDNGNYNFAQSLSQEDTIRLVRYMLARWDAYHCAYILAGDGPYDGERARYWIEVGRAVFGQRTQRPVTILPLGWMWFLNDLRHEPWFTFLGYQSCHDDSDEQLAWLAQGPPAKEWRTEPLLPQIDLELNYEAHPAEASGTLFDDHDVRRAMYWSLLVAPPAGATFGNHSIWLWAENEEAPADHDYLGAIPGWRAGLRTAGTRSISALRRLFDTLPWWQLQPAPELLVDQPGERNIRHFVAAARAPNADFVVCYLPVGETITIDVSQLVSGLNWRWYNPRNGEWTAAIAEGHTAFTPPSSEDWVFVATAVG